MADTVIDVNDALSNQLWGRKLYSEALRKTVLMKFAGAGPDYLLEVKDELSKNAGAKVTWGLQLQLRSRGISGDGTLEGNEEEMLHQADAMTIDQLRNAIRIKGNMSQQRVPWSMRAQAQAGLADWFAGIMDSGFFNQLGGNTAQNGTSGEPEPYNTVGMQAAIAPSSTRRIFADAFDDGAYNPTPQSSAAFSTEAGVGAWAKTATQEAPFRLELIDRCVARARTYSPPIRPITIPGAETYCLFAHPYQLLQMRQNSTSGQWMDIQKAAMTGGLVSRNPIWTGAHGGYNGTVIHEAPRAPWGDSSQIGAETWTDLGAPADGTTNIARAIFCGAQAGALAFGRANGMEGSKVRFRWSEKSKDYDNQLGVSAALIWGAKKLRFQQKDFATIVISTYSPAV